jgi:heptosyltransferase-2
LKRVLVIRGGAIGDFILTLPALKALRDAYPHSHIEILGYKHIAGLAEKRFYAQAVRSIEYGPLSSFFAKNSELPQELADYIASFDLIISYLYDPDRIFENNLRRCGVDNLACGPAKINDSTHAARQLLRPIEELGLCVNSFEPQLYPSGEDRQFAQHFLRDLPPPIVAIHPGSGSEKKNWPIENWIELVEGARDGKQSFMIISGEADERQQAILKNQWADREVRFAKNLPLPQLAAVLEHAIFIGHDSGISHLAAAAGAKCILLFGPTNPEVWAPLNSVVKILRAPDGDWRQLDVDLVRSELAQALMRIGIST